MRRGAIGQIRRGKLAFAAEVRSLAHVLGQTVGRDVPGHLRRRRSATSAAALTYTMPPSAALARSPRWSAIAASPPRGSAASLPAGSRSARWSGPAGRTPAAAPRSPGTGARRGQASAPRVESVSLVVASFGDDLRAGHCQVRPAVEVAAKATSPRAAPGHTPRCWGVRSDPEHTVSARAGRHCLLRSRGIGSLYYLAYASTHVEFIDEGALWALVAFTIFASTVIHGLTATSAVGRLDPAADGDCEAGEPASPS